MKPDKRSSPRHCLFCSNVCAQLTPPLEGGMEGAVHCPSLERHLLQFFILRHLLDIPSEWCEQNLKHVDENGDPESWFRVCTGCTTKWVDHAWQTYQKLMALEIKMRSIKEGVKKSMARGIKRKGARLQAPVGIENKIKTFVFPDLMEHPLVKSEPEAPFVADHILDDMAVTEEAHGDSNFSPLSNNQEASEDVDDMYDEPTSKAKRSTGKSKRKLRNRKTKRKLTKFKANRPKMYHRCTKCSSKFSDRGEFEGHIIAHEESEKTGGMYDCKICSFPARDSSELDVHTSHRHDDLHKKGPKAYTCSHCDFTSITWIALKTHFEDDHPDAPETITDFELRCTLCSKEFESRSALVIHQKKMHPELFGTRQESITCDQCTQLFPSLIHLNYHIKSTHSRITRYQCDMCGMGFRFIKSLERHKVSHEKGKRDYQCHICGVDYAYQSILDAHYRKFHPQTVGKGSGTGNSDETPANQELFTCKYCDMKTPFKPVMLRHMQTHKEKMGNQCDICGKYYTNYQGLKRHKRINHSTTNEVVNCPHCFKEFPTVDYMKTHITKYCKLKHLKENPQNNYHFEFETPQEEPIPGQFIQETSSIAVVSSSSVYGKDSEPQLEFEVPETKVEDSKNIIE